jgi:1,2-phenylacetyl-CoA epoxidase catalytic subunit
MQKVCAYKPMADSMPPMLREAFHLAAGVIPLRRFAERAATGDPLANLALDAAVGEQVVRARPRDVR